MLMLVGYDLTEPANRDNILGEALRDGSEAEYNIRNMPWLVDTEATPRQVLAHIVKQLRLAPDHPKATDRILVLPVCAGGCWAQRSLRANQPKATTFIEDRLGADDRGAVLAVGYTLHDRGNYKAFQKAIEGLAIYRKDGYCHPVEALSFVATDRTPLAVCEELTKSLPDKGAKSGKKRDDLLVMRIPTGRAGAEYQLRSGDAEWFRRRRIMLSTAPRVVAKPKAKGKVTGRFPQPPPLEAPRPQASV